MDKRKNRNLTRAARDNIRGWLFVSVWVIGFFIFTIYPIFRTIKMSFESVIISGEGLVTRFVGTDNYRNTFLADVNFIKALIQYIGGIVLEVPIAIVFSLLIALVLSKDIRGKGLARTVFFLPVIIISGPVMEKFTDMGLMAIQGTENSMVIENMLMLLPQTLSTLLSALIDSFVMILWFCGVQILLFLSAIQKMDKSMYEAAHIDGASVWESFWLVTLPNLRNMIVINIIYTIVTISTFDTNELIMIIQGNMFDVTLGLGYAAAQAWVYFFTLLLVIGLFMLLYGPRNANIYGSSRAVKKQMREHERLVREQKRELRRIRRFAGKRES